MSDKVLGLDLSDYRKNVPLKTAKQQGVRFVINKATQGTNIVHETNEIYRKECKALGLPFGNYMYWKFNRDAKAQALFYLEHMGEVQFPPIVDFERYYNCADSSNTKPIVSVQANLNHLKIVLNILEEETGIKPMIYTNYASWNVLAGNSPMILEYPLWVASWRLYGEPYLPKPAVDYKLHQYTANYQIAGYYRGVDANKFNGNEAAFEQYVAQFTEQPEAPGKQWVVTTELLKGGDSNISLLNPGDPVVVKVSEV